MVIKLRVTQVFHLNHRDVRVDENSPQRSHDFSKTWGGGVFTGQLLVRKGFIKAERVFIGLNLTVVMESKQKNAF